MSRKRSPTRFEELRSACERAGFTVDTYSPGDGVTRYRFGPLIATDGCRLHLLGDGTYAVRERVMSDGEHVLLKACRDYFAMRNDYTALGLAEARAYAAGRGARIV